jgi:hypothetical protein
LRGVRLRGIRLRGIRLRRIRLRRLRLRGIGLRRRRIRLRLRLRRIGLRRVRLRLLRSSVVLHEERTDHQTRARERSKDGTHVGLQSASVEDDRARVESGLSEGA